MHTAYMHTGIHVWRHADMPTCIHACIRTCIRTYTYTYTYTYPDADADTDTETDTWTYVRASVHTYGRTYAHSPKHIYIIHSYTDACTLSGARVQVSSCPGALDPKL